MAIHRPTDREFNQDAHGDEYDGFYEHHFFQPLTEQDALHANRKIARVGWALDVARELQPSNILDLGCLDGSNLLTLVSHLNNEGGSVKGVGVDLSQEGIDIATERADKYELPIVFKKQKLEDYLKSCDDESVGLICFFEVIEHVEDPDAVMAEIHRVLAPGGTVLVSTPSFESPLYGMDDETNKCHVRLYTVADEDYEAINRHGHTRRGTSMPEQLKDFKVESMDVFAELIHARASK